MANEQKKKLTPTQQQYQSFAKQREPKVPAFKNSVRAFFVGGSICLLGQCIQEGFIRWGNFNKTTAGSPTVAVLIIVAVLLTGFGVYDKIAQWAGAGTGVPVTGFANSMASAAIEHKSEGIVLGVGGQMFKIAGPVIVFGTVAAFVVGIIHLLIKLGTGGLS